MSNQSAMERTRATLRSLPARFRKAPAQPEPTPSVGSQVSSEFGQFLSENNPEAAAEVLELIFRHGQLRDSREQSWLIDQAVRQLTGENYGEFIEAYSTDEEFGHSFSWDQGRAPKTVRPNSGSV